MYRFGGFEVDPRTRELRRGHDRIHLEPQAFDLLVHLIEHREEVVANRDLLDGVWGHRFVSEAAITTRIKEIRRVLDDDGTRQHTIRNVRGRGYRFVAEVDARDRGAGRSHQLIGRRAELAAVAAGLDEAAVVTIAGPGGVGKSTLARAAMVGRSTTFPDGVHLVELAPLERREQVLPAVARTLGIVLDVPEHAIATIGRLHALVVLDNCEHVVDEVADLVERALATSDSRLHVLATSQIRLGVAGEQVIGLAPLDREVALRLFEARTLAIRPDWSLNATGLDRVHALLDHIDRLPLTIEMAAARLGSMTFDELETAVVQGGGWPVQMSHRTPSRRHRSLQSLVQWSADLLAPEHRRIFEECSVFADAFSIAEAIPVLAPDAPDDAIAAIGELVDRSLLSADVAGSVARYRMLDSIKTVARRWLTASGRAQDVHHRHASAVSAAVASIDRGLRSDAEPIARRRFDTIVAELRQAHRRSIDHEPELAEELARGLHLPSYGRLWSEPASWSAALIDRPGTDRSAFPASRSLIAGAAVNAGQLDAARTILHDVLATCDDPVTAATAHEILSDLCIYTGDLDGCAEHVTELDALGRELDDPHMVALAATNASLCLTFSGAAGDATARLDELHRDDLSPSSRAWLAYARGEACSARADHGGATDAFLEAIELATSVDNPFVVSVAESSLAAEHARAGSHREALEVYARCLDGYRRHGNVVHAVTTLRNLVGLLATTGDDRAAAIIGSAASAPGLRPTYGLESLELDAVLDSIRTRVGPANFEEWTATGRELDLDATIARSRSAVTARLDRP